MDLSIRSYLLNGVTAAIYLSYLNRYFLLVNRMNFQTQYLTLLKRHWTPTLEQRSRSYKDGVTNASVCHIFLWGTFKDTWWCSWLEHCATTRKVAGSIPGDVIVIFHWHNPSGRTMALRLTQPLTEMNATYISWGVKAADGQGWQPYHLHVPTVLKSGSLILLEHSRPVQACNWIALLLSESESDSLRAGRSGDRIPVGTKCSSSVQTGPGAHSASFTMGPFLFPGLKRPERGVKHLLPSSAEVKEKVELHLFLLSVASWQFMGWLPVSWSEVIQYQMNWEPCEMKRPWPNLTQYSSILMNKLR